MKIQEDGSELEDLIQEDKEPKIETLKEEIKLENLQMEINDVNEPQLETPQPELADISPQVQSLLMDVPKQGSMFDEQQSNRD